MLQVIKFVWTVWVIVIFYREKNLIPKMELFWKTSVRYAPNCFKLWCDIEMFSFIFFLVHLSSSKGKAVFPKLLRVKAEI